MIELLAMIVFLWLMVKAIGLACKLTWGATKVIASILIGLALPVLVVSLVFVGGIALIIPIAVVGIAVGILKTCV